jgi:hypothetical protein
MVLHHRSRQIKGALQVDGTVGLREDHRLLWVARKNLDPSLLMWDMRRGLNTKLLPDRRCTIQFLYSELPPGRKSWWLVVDAGAVDLCNLSA